MSVCSCLFFPAVFYTEVKFEEKGKKRGEGRFFCFAWTFGEQLLSLLNQSRGLEIDARRGPILEGVCVDSCCRWQFHFAKFSYTVS